MKQLPYKSLKKIAGFCITVQGIILINQSFQLFMQINESKKHPYICTFVGAENPSNYLFPGLYIFLVGTILIFSIPVLLKTLINLNTIIPSYFLFYFVLFSILNSQINISLDFVNKIFICLGMYFSTIYMSKTNNFD